MRPLGGAHGNHDQWQGRRLSVVCKQIGITDQTYFRWRKEYGGLKVDQAKRFKELEQENARLKRLLADAELDKAILREAARPNFLARREGDRRSNMSRRNWT